MPIHWTTITSSPPQARRDEVARICKEHGGRLCENQIYYTADEKCFALIEAPDDQSRADGLLDALGAHEWLGLVHADEKAAGKHPHRSGHRPS